MNGSSPNQAEGLLPTLRLQSCDGKLFEVNLETAKMSRMLNTMVEDCVDEEKSDISVLQNVDAATLELVLKWAEHHKNDPVLTREQEEKEELRCEEISPWDAEFLANNCEDQATLFDLILAANFLDIKGLLSTTCKAVANMIKGKQPQEIRDTFNIPNDFDPSEEEQIRKENEWCEEK